MKRDDLTEPLKSNLSLEPGVYQGAIEDYDELEEEKSIVLLSVDSAEESGNLVKFQITQVKQDEEKLSGDFGKLDPYPSFNVDNFDQ